MSKSELQKIANSDIELTDYLQLSERMAQGEQLSESEKQYFLDLEDQFSDGRDGSGGLDNQGGPDDFQYVFRDNVAPDDVPYEWIELRGDEEATWIGGYVDFTSWDDGRSRAAIPIGFPFPFYGVSYDSFIVATNGFLEFTTTATTLSNVCLPASSVAGPMIAVFWDDLHLFYGGRTDTITIGYKSFEDYFVIEFDEIGFYTSNCRNQPLKFEAILYPNGSIKLQYNTIIRPATNCENSQTIGIQEAGAAGSSALNYVCNETGIQPEDGLAILFERAPGVPNPCSNVTAVYNDPDVALTWNDPPEDTQGNPITIDNVEVWLGAAESGQLLATVGPGVQSYVHSDAPIGNLTYTIRPYLDPYYGMAVSAPVQVGTPSYFNDFEADDGLWEPTPETDGWGWGPPWGVADLIPYSGQNVWGTQLTGNYGNSVCWQLDFNQSYAVISPAAAIEFWFWNKSQLNYDGTNFKASVDNGITWTVLTPSIGEYNVAAMNTANACIAGEPGWSSTTPLVWQNVVIPVGEFLGQAPIFRFEFSSNSTTNSYPGFYFDDMTMWGLQPQAGIPQPCTNLTAEEIDGDARLTWTDPVFDTQGNPITIDNVEIWLGTPGIGVLVGTVGAGIQSFMHVNPPSGHLTYSIRAYLDPYYGQAVSTNLTVGTPSYSDDFETDEGLWESDNPDGWQWGSPSNGPGSAHSGTNCWGTLLDANYPAGSCFSMILDLPLTVESPTASVEFWCWYDSELAYDGCNLKVSADGGNTWEIVDPVRPYDRDAFNTTNACIPGERGWAGHDQGFWEYMVVPIGQYVGQILQYKFTFGSDGSVQYTGFFFDDLDIWGLSEPVGAPVSGTITLDGGAGAMTSVSVHANGLGNPVTNPIADGTYILANVLVGERTIWAALNGYHDASTNVILTEAGLTGVNLSLIRLDPPVPTGLDASINSATGVVTLDWDTSADPLVDSYNVYRKLQDDANYVQVGNVATTLFTNDLSEVGSGIYHYAISAVDEDVTTPVESDMTAPVTVLYGELPPSGLVANGSFDDKIVLDWFEPGTPPSFEIFYDDGTNEVGGIGFNGGTGWLVSRFSTVSGPAILTSLKMFFTSQAIAGDPFQLGIFADNGGLPEDIPLFTIEDSHTGPYDDWRTWELPSPVVIPSGVFYIGVNQTATANVSVGGDQDTPFINNTFYYKTPTGVWTTFEPAVIAIPMFRCFASGSFAAAMESRSAPIKLAQLPDEELAKSRDNEPVGSKLAKSQKDSRVTPPSISASAEIPPDNLVRRAAAAVARHAPNVSLPVNRRQSNALDDVVYYIVYRRPAGTGAYTDIGHPTTEHFENTGLIENVFYDYQVTAFYDNDEESGPTSAVTMACNMAPAAPTSVNAVSDPPSGALITWIDPIANADGSPCVDLTNIQVFRDNVLVGTVASGEQQYTDTPAQGGYYTWTLRAIDEVPNVSDESNSAGGIAGNPSYFSNFDTDDGDWISDNPDGWQWGAPTNGPGAAHSGTNCWGTLLSADYPAGACYQLTLNPEMPITQPDARLEFWTWYDTELSYDGCNLKVSSDGTTWEIVDPVRPYDQAAFNTANTCIPGERGWAGHEQGFWEYMVVPLGA
ncbi:immune inhibitor A, partial [bacterium]|nr:immune inhibitor A [bacterium]